MLRVGIVGCGKIADTHVSQILRVADCEIVGACDRELLMAQQLRDRFPVKRYFADLPALIDQARPDVVHITTPPDSHFDIAQYCLEHGCHVYVEKPFTLDFAEAQALVALASKKALKLTVGHNYQFSHVARRMRALVHQGYLGAPVHMECHYGYDLGDPSYARALLGDRHHWVRQLPGRLLHNIISHGIARIAEFLSSSDPDVIARGFVSPFLRRLGEVEIVDELRVMISDDERATAYFTFSSQMRPSVHEFRIYGTDNGLVLDQNHEILLQLRGRKFKSYADTFIPPVMLARQYFRNLAGNAKLFLKSDFHMDSGMKYLIDLFYRSIREDGAVPIPYAELLRTARIMDEIFAQLRDAQRTSIQDLHVASVPFDAC